MEARFSAWQCAPRPERLRIGFVSGDLHNHPVGYFLESVLAQIDSSRMELIAYPTDHKVDELTAPHQTILFRLEIVGRPERQSRRRLIHADGIHVLLDCSGHTGKNRLPMFAWKPAPVQASWPGYFATDRCGGDGLPPGRPVCDTGRGGRAISRKKYGGCRKPISALPRPTFLWKWDRCRRSPPAPSPSAALTTSPK